MCAAAAIASITADDDLPRGLLIARPCQVRAQNIDCMQLVMKRSLWLKEGGWYDKRELGDGYMYEKLTRKYGYRNVDPVLGEHF